MTLPFRASQPMTGAITRLLGLGAPQPGRPGVVLGQRLGQRLHLAQLAAQVGVGACRGPCRTPRPARRPSATGVIVIRLTSAWPRRRRGCRSSRRSGSRCRGTPRRCPGATLEARCGEHRVAHRGGDAEPLAERGDGPLDDVLGRGQLELGAPVRDQLAQLLRCAALGVGAASQARGSGRGARSSSHLPARTRPSDFSWKARRQERHSQAPCARDSRCRRRPRAATGRSRRRTGSGTGDRALAHAGSPPRRQPCSPRSSSSSARATQAAKDSPPSRSAR